jgi:hypothetical protein
LPHNYISPPNCTLLLSSSSLLIIIIIIIIITTTRTNASTQTLTPSHELNNKPYKKARARLKECEKAAKAQSFAEAIESEETAPFGKRESVCAID